MEEAFQNLINPEILEGNNKYECAHCKKKVEKASKGQKFKKLPKILVIQLMRFVFDFTTMNRKKLYDQCTFPLVLNMNLYVDGQEGFEKIKSKN